MGNFLRGRRKSATTALVCSLVAITLVACETGWSLSLTLNIPPELDRTRQLKILLFEARTIGEGLATPLRPVRTWLDAESTAADTIELSMFDPVVSTRQQWCSLGRPACVWPPEVRDGGSRSQETILHPQDG